VFSLRAANRGWGYNVSPSLGRVMEQRAAEPDTEADGALDSLAEGTAAATTSADAGPGNTPDDDSDQSGGGDDIAAGQVDAPPAEPWAVHPIGWVAAGLLVVAALYHTVFDTHYLIGNLELWHWGALLVTVGMSVWPVGLNGLRAGIDSISSVTKRISMFLAWFVFLVQLFNVVTRYTTRYVEQDILIGQATSLAWQSFAALFLLGANYGIRDGVNPRIDFWWANFTDRTKAWLDFVLHVTLFVPFVFMAIRILQPYAAISLGRKRDGTWPSGYKVWETWEQSSDADQLPVGPVKMLLLVGFVLIGIQLISELIKTGFIMAGRRDFGKIKASDAPQRIE